MESDETGPPTRFGWLPPLRGFCFRCWDQNPSKCVWLSWNDEMPKVDKVFPTLGNKVTYELPLYLPNITNLICNIWFKILHVDLDMCIEHIHIPTFQIATGSHASEVSTFFLKVEREGGESEDDSQASPATWTFPSGWTSGLRESPLEISGDDRKKQKKNVENGGKVVQVFTKMRFGNLEIRTSFHWRMMMGERVDDCFGQQTLDGSELLPWMNHGCVLAEFLLHYALSGCLFVSWIGLMYDVF